MARFPERLARVVHRQRGVVTVAQLARHGIGPAEIDRLRCRGLVVRAHPHVLRIVGSRLDLDAACVVACLAHSHGVIGGAAAAALWGFDRIYRPVHPEFVHPSTAEVTRPVRRVVYRPCDHLDELVTVERSDGVRLLDRAETWLDCVADLNADHAEAFTRHVLDAHCSSDELLGAVERWESRRRSRPPGRSRRLVTALAADVTLGV